MSFLNSLEALPGKNYHIYHHTYFCSQAALEVRTICKSAELQEHHKFQSVFNVCFTGFKKEKDLNSSERFIFVCQCTSSLSATES